MSKYIKIEDAIHKYAEMFADEAYWEYGVGDGKPDEEDLRIARIYYADLPTIEVSEDCISREWILKEFQKGKEKISKSEYFDELMWNVKHAPSVVPTTEQSCDTCRHNKREWFSEECDGCTKADSNYEPTTEQSSKVGEWEFKSITNKSHVTGRCSLCKERRVLDNYCSNCGAKMKG